MEMSSLVVRNLDPYIKQAIAERAKLRGNSMEAEVREILTEAVASPNPFLQLHQMVTEADANVDLELPPREHQDREIKLP